MRVIPYSLANEEWSIYLQRFYTLSVSQPASQSGIPFDPRIVASHRRAMTCRSLQTTPPVRRRELLLRTLSGTRMRAKQHNKPLME